MLTDSPFEIFIDAVCIVFLILMAPEAYADALFLLSSGEEPR